MEAVAGVGGFNPSEKKLVKLDHFPKLGWKMKNMWVTTT